MNSTIKVLCWVRGILTWISQEMEIITEPFLGKGWERGGEEGFTRKVTCKLPWTMLRISTKIIRPLRTIEQRQGSWTEYDERNGASALVPKYRGETATGQKEKMLNDRVGVCTLCSEHTAQQQRVTNVWLHNQIHVKTLAAIWKILRERGIGGKII